MGPPVVGGKTPKGAKKAVFSAEHFETKQKLGEKLKAKDKEKDKAKEKEKEHKTKYLKKKSKEAKMEKEKLQKSKEVKVQKEKAVKAGKEKVAKYEKIIKDLLVRPSRKPHNMQNSLKKNKTKKIVFKPKTVKKRGGKPKKACERVREKIEFYQSKFCPTDTVVTAGCSDRFARQVYTEELKKAARLSQDDTPLKLLSRFAEECVGELCLEAYNIAQCNERHTLTIRDLECARSNQKKKTVASSLTKIRNETTGRTKIDTSQLRDPRKNVRECYYAAFLRSADEKGDSVRRMNYPTESDLLRILARYGVERKEAALLENIRAEYKYNFVALLKRADILREHGKRKTLNVKHVQSAWNMAGNKTNLMQK